MLEYENLNDWPSKLESKIIFIGIYLLIASIKFGDS